MSTNNHPDRDLIIHGQLSFRPLVLALRKNVEEGNPGMKKLYGQVLSHFKTRPELMSVITDPELLRQNSELIEELLSAVFPPTTVNFMYGVTIPFSLHAVYASPQFRKRLLKPASSEISIPEIRDNADLQQQQRQFAYNLILKKYLGYNSTDNFRSVYPYTDAETGLRRFMEMRLDGRFIDVQPVGEMPELPAGLVDRNSNRMLTMKELTEKIPLEKFHFEGVSVIRINDMTESEVIARIKNRLLENNAFSDADVYTELEEFVQCLLGLRHVSIGVTPFFRINDHYVYSDLHNNNSILFRHAIAGSEKDEISDYCKILFRDHEQPLLFETLTEQHLNEIQFLQHYYREGARSLILFPLKLKTELLGMLEIISPEPGYLGVREVARAEAAMPLFTFGLEKSLEKLNSQVDRIIKKKFTAVQPAVEWKFTDTAIQYIVHLQAHEEAQLGRINFPDVFPLYSAIDIRNSSTERSLAIQRDVIEQLTLVKGVIREAMNHSSFPLLQEIDFKTDKLIAAATDVLESEEEMIIHEFLQGQIVSVFNHLRATEPALKNPVESYFAALDPQLGLLYRHRRDYENSITRLNETLSRFVDKEQVAAQKVYPHYFERYVTDGLEFNIYIGQSISPRKRFDEIYLRNLRMWQLTVMAKAARLTHQLQPSLLHPLRTTQLILCYSQSLCILFRTEERKFDVDGAQNVRYEILKKRIDKVRVRDTNERLTQPGKIAIVYTQARDASEYTEYIEFLQSKNLLKPGIERFDLEELQGVSGLKALRVEVNTEEAATPSGATASVHVAAGT